MQRTTSTRGRHGSGRQHRQGAHRTAGGLHRAQAQRPGRAEPRLHRHRRHRPAGGVRGQHPPSSSGMATASLRPLDFVLMGVVLALFSCGLHRHERAHGPTPAPSGPTSPRVSGAVAGAAAGYLALVCRTTCSPCAPPPWEAASSRATSALSWGSTCPGGRCPPCSGWSCGSSAPRGWTWARAFSGVCLVLELVIIVAAVGAVVFGEGLAAFPAASFASESFVRGSPGARARLCLCVLSGV